jgi:hypothetical protein
LLSQLLACQVSAEEVNMIRNPPPEALVAAQNYQAPPQQQQQQQYPQQQQQQQYGGQQYGQQQYGQRQQQSDAVAAGFPPLIPDVPGMPQFSNDPTEARWIELFSNPGLYYDNRATVSCVC